MGRVWGAAGAASVGVPVGDTVGGAGVGEGAMWEWVRASILLTLDKNVESFQSVEFAKANPSRGERVHTKTLLYHRRTFV